MNWLSRIFKKKKAHPGQGAYKMLIQINELEEFGHKFVSDMTKLGEFDFNSASFKMLRAYEDAVDAVHYFYIGRNK